MEQATAQVQPKGFAVPNGAVKKPHCPPPPPLRQAENVLHRECLKNHAASLGGHALDGCGEFMPSPSATPTDPTSLKCAACGCHRNFHRRVVVSAASEDDELEGEGEDDGRRRSSSPPPPSYFTSAPQTLLSLSRDGRPLPAFVAPVPPARKRFRSKFSPEQKGRMLELSKRLGWRMQKRDEAVVEEYCKEIGVGMGVFKIWMHNNKYHLFGSRRVEAITQERSNVADIPAGGGVFGRGEGNGSGVDSGVDSGEADGNGMNGSSSSS